MAHTILFLFIYLYLALSSVDVTYVVLICGSLWVTLGWFLLCVLKCPLLVEVRYLGGFEVGLLMMHGINP